MSVEWNRVKQPKVDQKNVKRIMVNSEGLMYQLWPDVNTTYLYLTVAEDEMISLSLNGDTGNDARYLIEWGDGNRATVGIGVFGQTSTHTYDVGKYCLTINPSVGHAVTLGDLFGLFGQVPESSTPKKGNFPELTSFHIGDACAEINTGAFVGCTSLTKIEVPRTVSMIRSDAFSGCTSIVDAEISASSIEGLIFQNCSSLKKVWLRLPLTTISSIGFNNPNAGVLNSPFNGCSSDCVIFAEAVSKPEGWDQYWNYYDEEHTLPVVWGQTVSPF